MNSADVEDAAQGHLWPPTRRPGERYILGGDNMTGRS